MTACALAVVASCGTAPTAGPSEVPCPSSNSASGTIVPRETIDATTLDRKMMLGYQGWFFCPGDGSPDDDWNHWFSTPTNPAPASVTVDFLPDMREVSLGEQCQTPLALPDGSFVSVYSAYRAATVLRHFQWMKDYDLDGVFLQRLSHNLPFPDRFEERNVVAQNVLTAAEQTGRVFATMYDISGEDPAMFVARIEQDWQFLVDSLALTGSPQYVHHRGFPVVGLWGFASDGRPGTPQDALDLLAFFHADGPYHATVYGGVPINWRTRTDCVGSLCWSNVLSEFDVISPWSVGTYVDEASAFAYGDTVRADVGAAKAAGRDYAPVVFPGFSWHNKMPSGATNQIPRNGGQFYWSQVVADIGAGSTMIYGAMFDEMDEGTAMFKLVPTTQGLPTSPNFVALDADGYALPSDWYLQLAGEAGRALRGERLACGSLPLSLPPVSAAIVP